VINHNTFNQKLREGKILLGCQVRSRSAMIAELYGLCGLDFVFIENEHFPWNMESIAALIQACDGAEIDSIVRIPQNNQGMILQLLDAGASGIFIPHIDTKADAEEAVKAGKYAPLGERGFSDGARATRYGFFDRGSYFETANQNTSIIPFIESKTAVENLDDILHSGIDAIHIGPGDLAQSYGVEPGSKKAEEIMQSIINSGNAAGIPVGLPVPTIEKAMYWVETGCRFISFSSDFSILKNACTKAVEEFRRKF